MAVLDKSTVDGLLPKDRPYYVWDDAIPGFGVRVTPAGTKTFVAKLFVNGRQSWVKIGIHGKDITAAEAKKRATSMRGSAIEGVDSGAKKKAQRAEKTVSELLKVFKSRRTDGLALNTQTAYNHDAALVGKAIGKMLVNDVTKGDIEDLFTSLSSTPAAANRVVQFCRTLFEAAIEWDLRTKANPARKVKKNRDNRRERVLTEDESQRLGKAMVECTHISLNVRKAIAFMAYMGMRIGEVRDLTWSQVKTGCEDPTVTFRWNQHKAGKTNGTKVLPLNAPALQILASMAKEDGNPYVFYGSRSKSGSLGNYLSRGWRKIRDAAKLNDGIEDGDEKIVAHTLRHTFVSEMLASGAGLTQAGQLAGHRSASSTSRYAHMVNSRARDLSNKGVEQLAARIPIVSR